MNAFLQGLLAFVVKKVVDAKLYSFIIAAVEAQFDTDLTGEQKKAEVKKQLAALTGVLGSIFKDTSTVYINLAIEAAVAILKAKLGK